MNTAISLEDRNKVNYGTPVNTQEPNWQHMITAPGDSQKFFQVIGRWKYGHTSPIVDATHSIEIEVRGPNGFVVKKFRNDQAIHKVPPSHSAWLRIADMPGNYGDNDTYWPDPLRFITGDAP